MANELQWSPTLVKDEHEKALRALATHKAKLGKVKGYKLNSKTIIVVPASMSEEQALQRVEKYRELL